MAITTKADSLSEEKKGSGGSIDNAGDGSKIGVGSGREKLKSFLENSNSCSPSVGELGSGGSIGNGGDRGKIELGSGGAGGSASGGAFGLAQNKRKDNTKKMAVVAGEHHGESSSSTASSSSSSSSSSGLGLGMGARSDALGLGGSVGILGIDNTVTNSDQWKRMPDLVRLCDCHFDCGCGAHGSCSSSSGHKRKKPEDADDPSNKKKLKKEDEAAFRIPEEKGKGLSLDADHKEAQQIMRDLVEHLLMEEDNDSNWKDFVRLIRD